MKSQSSFHGIVALTAYESILLPCNALLLVGVGVGETFNLTGFATKQTVQVGTDLVAFGFDGGVALSTSCLEADLVCHAARKAGDC